MQNDVFFSLQGLVFDHKINISEDIYHLACQQSDLGVIKLLVENAKKPKNHSDVDIEEGVPLKAISSDSGPLRNFLFGGQNVFVLECLNDKGALGEYMKLLHYDVLGYKYERTDNVDAKLATWSDTLELRSNIYVFELQNQDKRLINQHLLMNIHLNWIKNVEMLAKSRKKHFDSGNTLKQPMIAAVQTSNYEILEFLTSQFSEVKFEQNDLKEIFATAVSDANRLILGLLLKVYPSLKHLDENYIKELFISANQKNASFLANEFYFLSNKELFVKEIQNEIMKKDLEAINHWYENTHGSKNLKEQYQKALLKSAIKNSFPEAIDLLIDLYPSAVLLNEAIVHELFMECMKHPGIDVLECLLKHFSDQPNLSTFVETQTVSAIRYKDSEKLSFFIQKYDHIRNGRHGKFKKASYNLFIIQ